MPVLAGGLGSCCDSLFALANSVSRSGNNIRYYFDQGLSHSKGLGAHAIPRIDEAPDQREIGARPPNTSRLIVPRILELWRARDGLGDRWLSRFQLTHEAARPRVLDYYIATQAMPSKEKKQAVYDLVAIGWRISGAKLGAFRNLLKDHLEKHRQG
jgi:hypothetical protein